MESNRRKFLSKGAVAGVAGASTLGFPMIAKAQQTFNWKMTSAYGKGSPFYMEGPGSATDLARRITEMSNGRLRIQVFGAGELVPAFEGFDAVRAGTVEMNHANSYFWTGKTFAAQYFTAVPFGLNFQGMNGWLYDGGGLALWHEVYDPFGMIAFPCGNTGVQMTGWFKKEIKTVKDLQGLKMRIPGLAGKVYANLGVDVKVLPGGEIFPALERGVMQPNSLALFRIAVWACIRQRSSTTPRAGMRPQPSLSCSSIKRLGQNCRKTFSPLLRMPPLHVTSSAKAGVSAITPRRWKT
jgi:TRAP-type mannitol/chloroaromatic compound transport system substrate-binding protein